MRRLAVALLVPALIVLASPLAACGKKEDAHAVDAASEAHPTAQVMTADEMNRRAAEDAADAATAPADSFPAPVATGAPPPLPATDEHAAPVAEAPAPAAPAPAAHAPAPKAAPGHH